MTDHSSHIPYQCPQCGANLPAQGDMIICQYCGTALVKNAKSQEKTQPSYSQGYHMKTITCVDNAGSGLEAFKMLVPSSWNFQGGVFWLTNNPGMPAVIAFKVNNPNGPEAFEVFPNQPFYWTNNPMTQMTFPIGSIYYGNEVRPPLNALQTLQQLILPRFRNIPGAQIVTSELMPDLPRIVKQNAPNQPGGNQGTADGGKVRIEYSENQLSIEEEIYGVVEYNRIATPTFMGTQEMIFWVADYLFSFKAQKGSLDKMGNLFKYMVSSFRLNPQFFTHVTQISNYLIQNQIQQIKNVGQLSRYISQTSNQISDSMMQSYNQRQQVMDQISNNFSQAIRGVDSYTDTNYGQTVELPGGYTQAWGNNTGEYIVTDDPNFNPNVQSNLNWTQLQKNS